MPTIASAIKQVTQKAKCSNCGTVCQLPVEQWANSLEIQQLQLPNLRCSHCGHPWNDLPGPYAHLLRDAYWAPQYYWSTAGPAEKQNLARGISLGHQAELTGYLDDLQAALMLRYARALDTTSGSAFRAISSAADEEKFRTLDEHMRLWTSELLAMQRALISELEKVWHSYSIPSPDREWVPKATDIIWKPIENASIRWVIEALGVSADATIWLAPNWLFAGELQAARILNIGKWEATQNVLRSLCDLVQRKLSLQREEALNDARRKLRLRSRLPIESPQPHHGAGSMPEKLTKKRDLSREFDQVNLTDRQRECISLWLEYELSVSAIAKKLGLSRKIIDEHLHAAQAMFEREKGKQRVPGSRSGPSTRKPGRPPRLGRPFVECAGALWRQAMVDGHGNVSIDKLRQIASALDAANYLPPSAHLEPKYARPLKEFNSRNSNSKRGPVVTWSQLISLDDKEYLRGMRCLLSRCAKKRRFLVVRKLIADKKSRVA